MLAIRTARGTTSPSYSNTYVTSRTRTCSESKNPKQSKKSQKSPACSTPYPVTGNFPTSWGPDFPWCQLAVGDPHGRSPRTELLSLPPALPFPIYQGFTSTPFSQPLTSVECALPLTCPLFNTCPHPRSHTVSQRQDAQGTRPYPQWADKWPRDVCRAHKYLQWRAVWKGHTDQSQKWIVPGISRMVSLLVVTEEGKLDKEQNELCHKRWVRFWQNDCWPRGEEEEEGLQAGEGRFTTAQTWKG